MNTQTAPPRAEADGAAITALITAFFAPLLAIIFGHISRGQAKRKGLRPSAVATWGLVLGYVFTGLAVLLVIILVVATAKTASGPNSAVPIPPAGTTATSAAPAAGIGDPVRDGKFQFTVTSVTHATSVGDTADGFGDTAQGEYAILHVTVTNISDQPQTLNDSAQYVYDASGQKYDASSGADVDLNSGGTGGVFFNNINPGNTVRGELAFDMPLGVSAARAELHDSVFSDGVTVTLQ